MLTPNAVRLSALVAAAVSAGYLWRAALDHQAPQKVLVAVPPAIHFEPGADLFNSLTGLRAEATRIARQEALRPEKAQIASTSAQHASAHATGSQSVVFIQTKPASSASHQSGSSGSSGSSPARPKPKPKPKPPGGGHSKPPPPPAPPPPAPPQPAPPAPPPPPAEQPPAAPPPPPPPVGSGTRPGWGKGDRHHVHTGPPGHSGRKCGNGKRSRQDDDQHGQNWDHGEDNRGNDNHQGNEEQHGSGRQGGWNQGDGHGGGGHQGGGHGNHG